MLSSLFLFPAVFCIAGCEKDTSKDTELIVSFEMDKAVGSVGDTIVFTNTTTNASSLEWDFGDGHTAVDENPVHVYSDPGRFSVSLVATVDENSGSVIHSVDIWELVFNSTYYGDSIDFKGPVKFEAQPMKIIFSNESTHAAFTALWKHEEGYLHDRMQQIFINDTATIHHPGWTDVLGFFEEIAPGESYSWIWYFDPGLYTLLTIKDDPYLAWYVAGLTVSE
jgi:PKD repeat protein